MLSKYTKYSRKSIAVFLCLVLVSSGISAIIAYNVALTKAQSSSNIPLTLSGGPYPGAPTYTIFGDGSGNYYAKDSQGSIDSSFTSTDAAVTINDAIQASTTPATIDVLGTVTIQTTILLNKDVSLYFNQIDLSTSMITTGIDVTGTTGNIVQGNILYVLNTAWNASAILVENCDSVTTQVTTLSYYGNHSGGTAGTGIEYYANTGEDDVYCMIQNSLVSYFNIDVYYHTTNTGWINSNQMSNDILQAAGSTNLKLYDNGDGIGANTFSSVSMETPSANGYYVYITTGGSAIYPHIEFNEFIGFTPYDTQINTVQYYADSSVLNMRFIGGFVDLASTNWEDSGSGTTFNGVVDTSTGHMIQSSSGLTQVNVPTNAGWTQTNTTGSTTYLLSPTFMEVSTGANASSSGELWASTYCLNNQQFYSTTNPEQNSPFTISFTFNRHDDFNSTNEICYFKFTSAYQNPSVYTLGDLTQPGVGLKIVNSTVYGETYGSTLGTVTLGTNTGDNCNAQIVINPSSILFYLNGSLAGNVTASTQQPTEGIFDPVMMISANNGGVAHIVSFDISNIQVSYPN